jgi:predicted membrane protein
MNDFNLNNNSQPKFSSTLLAIGIGIILLGCMIALGNLVDVDYFGGIPPIRFWPLIIVAVGVAKIVENRLRGMSGWIITILGILLLGHSINRGRIENLFGPALLVAFGILIVLQALKKYRRVPIELQKSDEFVRGTAVLGAYSHKPHEGHFNGGVINAIFGGFDVDLCRTTMKYEAARMDVFILLGGGEIRVPEGWDVAIQVSAIGGAVYDKRVVLPTTDEHRPKLLITGTVLFGGVEVKCQKK